MEKGKLIVVEGACDGIGKSTQFELLMKRLEEDGNEITSHHFPSYETFHGRPVEEYLHGTFGKPSELSPYFVNTLYAADRAMAWNLDLKKRFEEGKILVLDRYTTSSLIYQSALIEDIEERKKFIDYVCDFEYNKLGIRKPDNVIFLHAPFDLVKEIRNARNKNSGVEEDIHERDLDFMLKVYENAMFLADYLSWDKIKCNDGDKLRSIEDIHEEIYQKVKSKSSK